MKKSTALLVYAACGLLSSVVLSGQAAEPREPALDSASALPAENTAAKVKPERNAGRLAERARKAAELSRKAADAKAAREANPRSEQSSALRRQEAESRLIAGLLGDGPVDSAALALAAEVAQDSRLNPQQRFEAAALAEMAGRKGRKFANREAWQADREAAARRLLADHPTVPAAYAGLLAVADAETGRRADRLARELLDSAAPADIKQAAHALLLRRGLEGRLLAEVVGSTPGGEVFVEKAGRQPLVFYTWHPGSPASLKRARGLAQGLPEGIVAYGVNLGPDIAAALAAAKEQSLPGEQLGAGAGGRHPLARCLGLSRPGLVVAVGRDGRLHNLGDAQDLAAALKQLN